MSHSSLKDSPHSDIDVATVAYHSKGDVLSRDTAEDPRDPAESLESRDRPELQGRVLGDFLLGEVLGQGGCGVVYRAEQRTLARPAVVKVVQRAMATRLDVSERFVREARLASRFDHPYAAHVYAFGVEHDGLMWIAMEFVDGTPLGQLIQQSGPLAVDRFVPLFERLCEVVQSAHDQGIVHRDIKPSNVMVIERAGRLMPKLLDFGIARLVLGARPSNTPTETWKPAPAGSPSGRPTAGAWSLTQVGQVLGSPQYMAPEQWRDATSAGPKADQYALALLAYEALTGAHAFVGGTIEAFAHQHLHAPFPALPPRLPAALRDVLARAGDKRPERRFANLNELAAAVRIMALGKATELEEPIDALPEAVAPYPGLAAYTATDHASFVGRERDVEELLNRLDAHSIVTVVGPSGSGKTSFLAAGLIPALEPRRHSELIRPGSEPLGALAAIAQRGHTPPYRDGLLHDTVTSPTAIAEALVGLAETRGIVTVLIVDQAEELFTMCADDSCRTAFAEVLVRASASPRIRVVLALRDDFLCRIEQLPAWRGLLGRAVHVLGIPRREDLERVITVPARRRGFRFDDPDLPREIVDQVADRPGALPLIAFTAAQLWERRDRRLRRLTRSAYQQIGGVTGALVQHADGVMDRMSVPDRRQARLLFRRLFTAEGARALIDRTELESSLGGTSPATVIDRLLAARLIVSHDDDSGDRIEIIHETLATTWPRLAAWRREDADGLRLQEQLAVAARHWNARARSADLLWGGGALSDLRRWRDSGDHSMTPVEQAFVRACVASASRRTRVRAAVVTSAFALLVAGVVALRSENRQIADQRAAAVDRVRTGFEERGRAAIGDGDHPRGLLYLAEASRLGAHGPAFDLLTSHAVASLDAGLDVIGHRQAGIVAMDIGPTGIVALGTDLTLWRWDRADHAVALADRTYCATLVGDLAVAVSTRGDLAAIDEQGHVRWRVEHALTAPDPRCGVAGARGARLVIASGKTVALWDLDTGQARGALSHGQDVSAVAIAADGSRLATGDISGVTRIWDTTTAALVATCQPHAGAVRTIKFAADQRSVVTGGNDADVRICDTATGATLYRLIGHSDPVLTVDATTDGRTIVSGGRDGKPRIWDARTGLLVRVLEGHRGAIMGVRVSPDNERILTLGLDGTARIWDREGTALGSLQGHGGPIYAGGWDLDGHHVITSSVDGAIRRWDPDRGRTTGSRHAHDGKITDLDVSGDDRWILTAGADRRAVLWDRRSLQPVAELPHRARVSLVRFAPDGRTALTVDADGNAGLWQLPAGTSSARFPAGVTAAGYLPGGTVVTAGDGRVRFWTADGHELGAVASGRDVDRLVVDPTGRWLFVSGATSSILVIDAERRAPLVRLEVGDEHVLGLAANRSYVAITDGAAIRLWRLGTWAAVMTLVGHKSPVQDVWFLPDGRLVSAAGDATLVWGTDGSLLARLADTSYVYALATTPDGSLFATTGSDGAIRVWDATAYRLLLQRPAHGLPAQALQLAHDGAATISGGNDGRLVTWQLTRTPHSTSELAAIVRCRVPLRLAGEVALPRDLDFEDPTCRALGRDR
jgi:WD40 repeat protein/serine/threonine protein kinase